MRLSDVISALGLTTFPIVAMVLFLLVFARVLLQVFRKRQSAFDHAAALPLADDAPAFHAPVTEQTR